MFPFYFFLKNLLFFLLFLNFDTQGQVEIEKHKEAELLPEKKNNHPHEQEYKVRIKDIVQFTDVRDNQLVGYGLVVGLNATGDNLGSIPFTKETVTSMLDRLGVNMRENLSLTGRNVAAVMVSATLPSFARKGSKIDVIVSSMGDATDLRGGQLLVTPLLGGHGEVIAVAQGGLTVTGIVGAGAAASTTVGVPTTGKIPDGAIIEKEVGFELISLKILRLTLRNPDFTTANRIANRINEHLNQSIAKAIDHATVDVKIPSSYQKNIVSYITEIEQLEIVPDQSAKVIIDPNGVIVMGNKVRISPVAVSHGSITIRVTETPQVYGGRFDKTLDEDLVSSLLSVKPLKNTRKILEDFEINREKEKIVYNEQRDRSIMAMGPHIDPSIKKNIDATYDQAIENVDKQYNDTLKSINKGSFDRARKNLGYHRNSPFLVTNQTTVDIEEQVGGFSIVQGGIDLQTLVTALNRLQISTREITQILQSIKAAGSLHAQIIIH